MREVWYGNNGRGGSLGQPGMLARARRAVSEYPLTGGEGEGGRRSSTRTGRRSWRVSPRDLFGLGWVGSMQRPSKDEETTTQDKFFRNDEVLGMLYLLLS